LDFQFDWISLDLIIFMMKNLNKIFKKLPMVRMASFKNEKNNFWKKIVRSIKGTKKVVISDEKNGTHFLKSKKPIVNLNETVVQN
jgi:hypothetical protein